MLKMRRGRQRYKRFNKQEPILGIARRTPDIVCKAPKTETSPAIPTAQTNRKSAPASHYQAAETERMYLKTPCSVLLATDPGEELKSYWDRGHEVGRLQFLSRTRLNHRRP